MKEKKKRNGMINNACCKNKLTERKGIFQMNGANYFEAVGILK